MCTAILVTPRKLDGKKISENPRKWGNGSFLAVEMPSTELYLRALGPALDSRLVLQSKENARDTRWVLLSSASFNRNRHSIGVI